MAQRKIAPSDFECEAAFAPAAYSRTFKKEEIQKILDDQKIKINIELPPAAIPVALRWRVSPNLGLPTQPFRLWRKIKKSSLQPIAAQMFNFGDTAMLLNGPFFRLQFSLKNNDAVARTFSITPLDAKYKEYGAKTTVVAVAANASIFMVLDQPNLSGMRITGGNFSLPTINGITMSAYLNDPAWELIQIVGLPYAKGTIDSSLYNFENQGYVNSLIDPESACQQRVDLYRAFYKDPPPTASDGAVLPPWKVPLGLELLKAYQKTAPIVNGQTGTLFDIEEMLRHVYKIAPQLYNGMQRNYLKTIDTLGIVDPANPNPQKNGTYQNPVCSATLLSAASDCWHALGLGFGATDFLPFSNTPLAGPINSLDQFDYMVTAVFMEPVLEIVPTFPFFNPKPKFSDFNPQEYAALCHFDVKVPAPPAALLAETTGQNRPLVRDDNYYDAVRLSWEKSTASANSPLCYAVAFKNNLAGGALRFLNAERPFIPGDAQPYVPALRADADAPDLPGREGTAYDRFFHDRSKVPFIGSVTQQYYVATQNVFGLWSAWAIAPHTLTAREPQIPTIVSAKFTTRHTGITNHLYPADLELVIGYDWDDRAPFEIHFGGYFVSPPVPEPPVTVAGITHSNSGGAMTRYRIRFSGDTPSLWKLNPANVLVAVPAAEGTVVPEPNFTAGSSNGLPGGGGTDSRAYRVTLKQMETNFAAQTRLYYTVYARAAEARNPAKFSVYSNEIIPGTALKGKSVVIPVLDPLPRTAPAFAPDIKWASLPDASNISRYHLKFTAVPGAVGYAVYVATEKSLRDRLNGIAAYPANGTIFQRRDALNGASAADRKSAIDAFTRISKQLLTAPEVELALNGDTDGLYIYAVSSFTDQNAESALSDWIYVAIPERITPASPTLTGFVKKTPLAVNVLHVEVGAGNNTSQIELFKTAKKYLGADINLMGLPYSTGPAAGWTKYKRVNGVETPVLGLGAPFDYYKIEQPAEPGWAPTYYRAVGLGLNQPVNGKLPGRSSSSNLLELLPPVPANPPDVETLALTANAGLTQLRLSFKSNAFVGVSPHGDHHIAIYRQNNSGLWEPLAESPIPLLKKMAAGTEPSGTLVRVEGLSNNRYGYVYVFNYSKKVTLKVSVSDPLGRKTEKIIGYVEPADQIVIKDIALKKLSASSIGVSFKTTVSKVKPLLGTYTLNIRLNLPNGPKSLMTILMHKIPDTLPALFTGAAIAGGTTKDSKGFYTYGAVFKDAAQLNLFASATAIVIAIKDPSNHTTEKELKL